LLRCCCVWFQSFNLKMSYMIIRSLKVIIGILLICLCCASTLFAGTLIVAEKGVQDLRYWDFNEQGAAKLDGEWEVYWSKIIYPGQFGKHALDQRYFPVPTSWNDAEVSGKPFGHQGYATYRLKVLVSKKAGDLSLNVIDIFSNFEIFVNGKSVSKNGTVNDSIGKTADRKHPMLVSDSFDGEELEIVVHVSNQKHARGGIFRSILLGQTKQHC